MVINTTPHTVHMVTKSGGVYRTYPAASLLVRVEVEEEDMGNLEDGTPLIRTTYGRVRGLPEYVPGTWYIVSRLVKLALPNRPDLLVPSQIVRNSSGAPKGCRSLSL